MGDTAWHDGNDAGTDPARRRWHDGLVDPDHDPLATYVLEPEDVRSMLARVVTSRDSGTVTPAAPWNGAPIAAVPCSTPDDVATAVTAARRAQRGWARLSVRARTEVLRRFAMAVLEQQTDVLDLIQLETGKARASAYEEIVDVCGLTRYLVRDAGAALRTRRVPGLLPVLSSVRVQRHPVGVVGVVSPWNFPLSLAVGDCLPALAAGNAVVLRPDPQTPLTALWAAELLAEAGLPAGVLQVVVGGPETGQAVVDGVDHVIFTGSTAVGRTVAARAGGRLVGATVEAGGKNAMYVADDVDVEITAAAAARACFGGAGQVCLSPERIVVHAGIADRFVPAFVAATRSLRLGAGLDYRADIGSLTTAGQLDRVAEHVAGAIAGGARVLTGGVHRVDIGQLFYEPTILSDVAPTADVVTQETFGPVVCLDVVHSDDEAVVVMNDTAYGLGASVWTASARRGRIVAEQLRAGMVTINSGYPAGWAAHAAPQAGWGASGLGARHGREGLAAVTRPRTVAAQRLVHGILGRRGPGLGVERLTTGDGAAVARWTSVALGMLLQISAPGASRGRAAGTGA